ncbi:MAG: glycosyltransferase [Butyrivibrio sp.]|nr:glycosyltransferase [Butyrivibrio sp.]
MKNLLLMVPMLHQGGFERVCVHTARLLQDKYNVTILIFSSKDINYDVTGLNVVNIDVPSSKGILNKVFNVFKRSSKVRKYKKDNKIDISYSFGSSANYVNVLSRAGEKTLTGLRCSTDMESPRQVKLFCKKSDKVLSCSRDILMELKSSYNYDKSEYIYNPLDVEGIRQKALEEISDYPYTDEDFVISFMGRDDYIKGVWHLIKAFYIVHKKHPKTRLIILGAGNYTDDKELVKELGIDDSVTFTGVRKNPFPYVYRSNLYVLSSNHEGFPNALLEAMAMGKAVIAADCKTGPREIVLSDEQYQKLMNTDGINHKIPEAIEGEYGVLIPDMSEIPNREASHLDEEKILSDEILKMVEDRERLNNYSQKAYERALVYTPEKYKTELDNILKRV